MARKPASTTDGGVTTAEKAKTTRAKAPKAAAAPAAPASKAKAKTATAKAAAKAPTAAAKPAVKAAATGKPAASRKPAAPKKPSAKSVREELLTFKPGDAAPTPTRVEAEPPFVGDDTVVPFKPEPFASRPEAVAAAQEPVAVETRPEPRSEPASAPRFQAKVDVPKEYAGKPRGFLGRLFDALTGKNR